LQQIGQDVEDGDMDAIALQLEKCYVRHVELANRIRVINDTFEVRLIPQNPYFKLYPFITRLSKSNGVTYIIEYYS
jgi:hypothetical protein